MKKSTCILAALSLIAACATQETPKPAPPAPAPTPAPAPKPAAAPPAPAPEAAKPKPVAEKVRIADRVLFDFDRATLRPEGRSLLDDVAAKVRGATLESLIVTGHADRIGSQAYNLELSNRRAGAVKAYLVSKGFAAQRIYAEGKGEAQPMTGDKCSKMGRENRHNAKLIACLQDDRRVEIEIIGTRSR